MTADDNGIVYVVDTLKYHRNSNNYYPTLIKPEGI